MPLIEVDKDQGLNLNVHISDSSPQETIVMVHGMFGNLSQFYLTIAPLFSKKYRVVIFDLKSHGRSDKSPSGYDLDTLSNELRLLMDALNIPIAHILGFSYGALIALKFAMKYPARTKKIIAIEVPDKPKYPFKSRGDYTFDDFWGFVVHLHTNIKENFFRSKRQVMNTFKIYDYLFNHSTFSEDMNKENEFLKNDYEQVLSPVLLSYGRQSNCICELHRIKDWIPDVSIYLEDGDHGFFMENVEKFTNTSIEFLSASRL